MCFCFMLGSRSRFLMISESESGLRLQNQAFGRGVAKNTLSRILALCGFWYRFSYFSMALGPIFVTLDASETALKFGEFQWLSSGAGAEQLHVRFVVIWLFPGPYCSKRALWSSSSTNNIQYQTCRNKGIRKNQDAN